MLIAQQQQLDQDYLFQVCQCNRIETHLAESNEYVTIYMRFRIAL